MRAFLLLFILMLPAAISAETQIYDSWVVSGDTLSVDNREFTISIDTISDELVAVSGQTVIVVDEEDCELLDTLRFCYNDTGLTNDHVDRARLIIYGVEHELEIDRTFSSASYELGEEYDVELLISNTGTTTVDSITMREQLPEGLELESVSGCEQDGQAIVWQGRLRQGTDHDCSYTFIPRELGEHKLLVKLSYFDGYEQRELYSDLATIDPAPILETSFEASLSSPAIGQPMRLRLNITNAGDRSAELGNFTISLPPSLSIEDYSTGLVLESALAGSKLRWSDESFSAGESEAVFVDIRPTRSGRFDIYLEGDYIYRSHGYDIPLSTESITIERSEPIVTTSLTDGQEILSGESVEFNVWVENPFEYENLTDIRSRVDTELIYVSDGYLDKIIENGRLRIVDMDFFPPQLNVSTTYAIHINVTAGTPNGEMISDVIDLSVRIAPVKLLTLSSSLSSNSVTEGDSVTVSVSVSNPNNRNYSYVRIHDVSDTSLVKKGATSKTMTDLGSYASATAYQYEIISPDVRRPTNFTIISNVRYLEDSVERELQRNLTLLVNPRALTLLTRLNVPSSSVYEGQAIRLTFTISNNDVETVHDAILHLDGDTQFGVAGPLSFTIPELDPGESVTGDRNFLVPLLSGTQSFGPANLTYSDADGNEFSIATSTLSFSVSENVISSPMLHLTKTYEIVDDELVVTVTASNVGGAVASGNLSDGGLVEYFRLEPGQRASYSRNYIYDRTRTYALPQATAAYQDVAYVVHVFSEGISIEAEEITEIQDIPEEIPEEQSEEVPEEIPEDEPEEIVLDEGIEPAEKKRNIFVSIFELIKKVLFWQRSSEDGDSG